MAHSLKTILKLSGLIVLLIGVGLPRFNHNSLLIKRPLNDAAYYIAYVEYFRGEAPSQPILPATNWRPLVPYLASLLPFSPMTCINLINELCLAISLVLLYKTLRYTGIDEKNIWIGCLMYVLSFPVFYYSTIGFIDSGALMFVALGSYAIARRGWLSLFPILIVGLLAKEVILIIIPPAVYFIYLQENLRKAAILGSLYLALYLLMTVLIHRYAPITDGSKNVTFWWFSKESMMYNLTRINFYLSLPVTLGVPALLIFSSSFKLQAWLWKVLPYTKVLLVGVATALSLWFFSFLTTGADGRTIWMAYPFLIPYVAILLKYKEALKPTEIT